MSSAANSIITALARGFGEPPKVKSLEEVQKENAALEDVKSQTAQRNAIAQRQTAEAEALKRQAERDQADADAERNAWRDSNGDSGEFLKAMQRNASPKAAYGAMKYVHEQQKAFAEKTAAERIDLTAKHDRLAEIYDRILDAPEGQENPVYLTGMQEAVKEGLMHPSEVAEQFPGREELRIHRNVIASQKHDLEAQNIADKKAAEQRAAAEEAQKALTRPIALREATAKAGTEEQTLADKTRQSDATMLAAVAQKGPEALQAILDDLPLKRAKPFLYAKTPQEFLRLGMTPEQITTADANAAKPQPLDEAKLAYAVTQGQQPNATPEQKQAGVLADATLKRMTADKVAARPINQFVAPTGAPDIATIDAVPESIRGTVQRIINGDQAMPPLGRNNATNQAINYWVGKVDPSYTAARADLKKSAISGKISENAKSLNTVIAHLGSLDENINKLDNSAFRKYNSFANWLLRETNTDITAPFRTDRLGVSSELATALKGGVASVTEVQHWQDQIDAADSPGTLKSTVREIANILDGRMQALDGQLSPLPEASRPKLLTERAKKVLDRIHGAGGNSGTVRYVSGGQTYNIPKAEEADFLKDHKGAVKQ